MRLELSAAVYILRASVVWDGDKTLFLGGWEIHFVVRMTPTERTAAILPNSITNQKVDVLSTFT